MNSLEPGRIGHGHFGRALNDRFHERTDLQLHLGHSRNESAAVAARSKQILLAVRPDQVKDTLLQIRAELDNTLIISFAAAVPIEWMQSLVGDRAQVVRAMADIDFQQVMCQRNESSEALLGPLSQHPLIQTRDERDLDAMTTLVGCLPGIAAWQYAARPEAATQWLNKWGQMTESHLGIPMEVSHSIIEKVLGKGDFHRQVESVATAGGVTASMVDAMKTGEFNHHKLFQTGMDRIQSIAARLTQ